MNAKATTKITVNPQAQFIVVGGDSDILKRGDPSCNMGCDLRVFLDHSGFCAEHQGKVEAILTAGDTAEPEDSYYQNDENNQAARNAPEVTAGGEGGLETQGETFQLAGEIDEGKNGNSHVMLDKLMASLIYRCGVKSELDIQLGFAKNVQQDNCGRYTAGWYKCQSEYYGNAFEGFVNPFIWNKQTKGIKLTFRQGPLEAFGHYGNVLEHASSVGTVSQGFANTDTPGICDAGICYRMEAPCPMRLSLVCQQINNGSEGFVNPVEGDEPNLGWLYEGGNGGGSMTTAASAALAQSQEESQYVNSFTAGCDSEFQGVDLNGYLTCANVKNTSDDKSRILKWSLGCVSKCRPIKCLPSGGLGAQAFGLNVGTPAYLHEELVTAQNKARRGLLAPTGPVTLEADEVPLVCEASCLFNFCGFNVPLFVDYVNKHDGGLEKRTGKNNQGIYNVESEKGSALICGMRPNRFSGIECAGKHTRCFEKYILDCRPEGGDEDEDEC